MKLPAMVQGLWGKSVLRKTVWWLGGFLILFGVLGFLAAPALLRPFAEKKLAEVLHRPVSIAEVAINPYALSATVKGLSIKDKDGGSEFLGFDEFYVNVEADSLWHLAPVISDVRLANPRVHLVRNADKSYNISDLIEEFLKQPESDSKARYAVYNIRLWGGKFELDDKPMGRVHVISDLDVGLPFVSNLPSKLEVFVQPALSLKINGAPFALGGKARPFAANKDASIALNFSGLDLTRYFDYLPLGLNLKLDSAKLTSRLDVEFAQPEGKAPSVAVSGDVALAAVAAKDGQGQPLLSFNALKFNGVRYALAEHRLDLAELALDGVEAQILHNKDGSLNFSRIVPAAKPADNAPAKVEAENKKANATPPLQFNIAKLHIGNSRFTIKDLAPAVPVALTIGDFDLSVDHLSNASKESAKTSLAFKLGEALVKHEGEFSLTPLTAHGKLELQGLALKTFMPYVAPHVRFAIDDGALDAGGEYQFSLAEGQVQVAAKDLALGLKALRVRQAGEKQAFFALTDFALSGGELDLAKKNLVFAELKSRGGKLQVARLADGSLSLEHLTAEAKAAPSKPEKKPFKPAKIPKAAKPAPAKSPGAWNIGLKKLALEGWGLRLEDHTQPNAIPLVMDPIALTADNLSSNPAGKINLNLKAGLGKRGGVNLSGSIVPDPAQVRLNLDLKGLDLVPLQAYVTDHFNVTLSSGAINGKGQLAFDAGKGSHPYTASYKGGVGLSNLRLIDRGNASDLLVWQALQVGGIDLAVNGAKVPYDVTVKEISLADFYARLIINPDGSLALRQLVKPEGEGADSSAGAKPAETQSDAKPEAKSTAPESKTADVPSPYRVRIDKVALQGGRVNFSDFFIRPNYSANLTNIGGSVAGLSSEPGTTASVDLRGAVDGTAPLNINGKVNPLAKDLFLDLKADAKGIELAGLSPYSSRYAGYAIEKGKLSVDIRYFIENRKLQAENHVFLDQLTFGQRVEGPDATKLPVLLAVALLKNRKGEIDINLPVGGSLDDPQFSVGGIVIKVIVNVLVKAVTSPFALLGSMFGGGEELGYLEFDPGRSAITQANEEKLKKLAKALDDRPALKLDITGRVDPITDAEGIKRVQLERKVKAAKLKETLKKGDDAGALDDVVVSKEEWPKYLQQAYKDEKMPKPRNMIGLAKDLPPEEMEKLLLANTPVNDEGLLALATRRAKNVENWLVNQGKIAADRVFVVAPKLKGDEAKGDAKLKPSRVDFSLK